MRILVAEDNEVNQFLLKELLSPTGAEIVVAENGLLAAALATLNELHDALADFQPFHSSRAAVLSMAGQIDAARRAYDQAIALTTHESDRRFLVARAGRL